MKILLVDDDADFRALIRLRLRARVPGAEVIEYDPVDLGRPGAAFDWAAYDLLILDHELGAEDTGLAWLRDLRGTFGFPPTLLLTGAGDEYVAARAMKLGADEYLNKRDLTGERLAAVVTALAAERTWTRPEDATVVEPGGIGAALAGETDRAAPGIAGYRVSRLIAAGHMSRVYAAERIGCGTPVALKLIDAGLVRDDAVLRRFIREAELMAALRSPHVVHIIEQGFTDEVSYIAMELLPGGTLKERLAVGMEPAEAVAALRAIARGLDAIHRAGVVHRDLKPANLMYRADGTLVLTDFGISRRLGVESDVTLTGQVLGTPSYMSPEQGQGHEVDARGDLYSAGAIFFQMLSGRRPFEASNPTGIVYQHVHAPVPRVPEDLARYQWLVDRLLAKDPADRFQSAAALGAALDGLGEG